MTRPLLSAAITALLISLPASSLAQTAFRFTDLDLRDPHTWATLPLLGCRDITDTVPLNLAPSFNDFLQEAIETDQNGDGSLDLNGLLFFVPTETVVGTASYLDGTAWDPEDAVGEVIFHFGLCTPPMTSPICEPDILQSIDRLEYGNELVGQCLGEVGNSLSGYEPPLITPSAPCFFGEPFDAVLSIGGIPLPLQYMQIAATYVDAVPPRLVDGMIRGFLREAAADSVILPESIPLLGGQPISALLPGSSNCCASGDDRDFGPESEWGWWLYFNFEADEVPFTPATAAPVVSAAPIRTAALATSPNPFSERVSFSVSVPEGPATLQILDVRGRRVRSLSSSLVLGGHREISWDGTDARGKPLPAGVYFVRLETREGVLTRKVVRAH